MIEQTTTDEPIWTKYGVLPRSLLDYSTAFDDHIGCVGQLVNDGNNNLSLSVEKNGYITFTETYTLKETGEVVKQSVHVSSYDAALAPANLGNLN